jgi:phage major head subunit gpT-like protein
MPNPMTSSRFVRLFDKRLRKVGEDQFKEISPMIDSLYNRMPSDSAWEEFFEIGALGDIPEFNGKITSLSISPGYYNRIEPKEYAGQIEFERKLLEDKKFAVLDGRASQLASSAKRTMDKIAVRDFAYAFSASFDFLYSEEGKPLCSTTHLTKGGYTTTNGGFSNSGTSALSKTSVAATRLAMRRFRNDIGDRIQIEPDTLLVPDNLYDTAMEIVGSEYDPLSANNTINMQYKRFKVVPYLRLDDYSTANWFMIDSSLMKLFHVWIERVAPQTNNTIDFDTFIWKYSVYFRIAYGFLNWRWIYGMNLS